MRLRVHAAAVNPLDWHNVRGLPYPLRIGNGLVKPNPRGTYVVVGAPSGRWLKGPDRFLKALVLSPFVSQRMVPFLEAGKVTPVIDRSYGLTEVPEAIRYLGEGHARGKVIIAL